tara:strand:+ start:2714 stop:3094 length:381 start_codon:yes stop_codon:yes gene_type:complete
MAQQHQECPHGFPVHECDICQYLLATLENIRNGQRTISRDVLQRILRIMLNTNNYRIRRSLPDRITISSELRGFFVEYLNSFRNSYPTNRVNIARNIVNYINTRNAIASALRNLPNNVKRKINKKK